MKSSDTDMSMGKKKDKQANADMDMDMDMETMNQDSMEQGNQQSGDMGSMNQQSGTDEGTMQQSNRSGLGQENAHPPEMMTEGERMDAAQVGNMQSGAGMGNMQSDQTTDQAAIRPADQIGKPPRSNDQDANRPGIQNQSDQGNNQGGNKQ